MLQLFYLDVACVKRMSQIFYLFQMHVVFECFMLQVQTTGIGIYEGGQGQAAATDAWSRRKPPAALWGEGTGRTVMLWKEAGACLPGGLKEMGAAPV
jgi:hypothetical protein